MLIFDGLFLQRPELAHHWNTIIYLTADTRLDQRWNDHLLTGLPDNPTERANTIDTRLHRARWPRYRDGWTHYTNNVNPAAHADIIIDNNNLKHPAIVKQST